MARPGWMRGLSRTCKGGDGLACEVSDLITDLVMKICDEATLFTVQGIKGNKICILVITVMREV